MRTTTSTSTIAFLLAAAGTNAFAPPTAFHSDKLVSLSSPLTSSSSSPSTSALNAIGVLARKAKEADVRKYCEAGVPEDVLAEYQKIKDAASGDSSSASLNAESGPLQTILTKRRGTITVIAEYKRKVDNGGFIGEQFDPEILSPMLREYGASAIAVMADARMGGCTYDDVAAFCEEQRRARNEIPGPVCIINTDLIVDHVQLAQTVVAGAKAVVVTLSVVTADKLQGFLEAAQVLDLETIVSVATPEEAQTAVDLGAKMILVTAVTVDEKVACIENLAIPEGRQVTTIAYIYSRNDKGLFEIEEAWACRDKGFHTVWAADALYKNGMDSGETPGSIIKSMTAKASLKWASPKARSGKGEGAREYLGDIMM